MVTLGSWRDINSTRRGSCDRDRRHDAPRFPVASYAQEKKDDIATITTLAIILNLHHPTRKSISAGTLFRSQIAHPFPDPSFDYPRP
jgi:hypothetical protein